MQIYPLLLTHYFLSTLITFKASFSYSLSFSLSLAPSLWLLNTSSLFLCSYSQSTYLNHLLFQLIFFYFPFLYAPSHHSLSLSDYSLFSLSFSAYSLSLSSLFYIYILSNKHIILIFLILYHTKAQSISFVLYHHMCIIAVITFLTHSSLLSLSPSCCFPPFSPLFSQTLSYTLHHHSLLDSIGG